MKADRIPRTIDVTKLRKAVRMIISLVVSFMSLVACNEDVDNLVKETDINTWKYFTEKEGLSSDNINAIHEDSKGNIWVGTSNGITVFTAKGLLTYDASDGLLDNNVFAIAEDRDGNIWAGTPMGLNIFHNNQWQYFTYFYGAGIYALIDLQDEQGILIGTGGYGTYRYDYTETSFSRFDFVNGCQECNSINSIFQGSDKSIWIATFAGARRLRNNSISTFNEQDGMPGNIATTIAEDSWGNIWIGTVEGRTITKIAGGLVSQVGFNNGAGQNFIFGIQEDNEGKLWVGTVANGLFHYDGAIMRKIYEGPPDNTITALLKDSHGNLWIGTSQGGLAKYITNPLH